ncbi:winged helix-turn-helix transcriptional regulator [Flexivirga sp. B27]
MRHEDLGDADCGIAQTLGVVRDWWSWLIVREISSGVTRFDVIQDALGISRRALSERLASLVDDGLVERRAYSTRPPRHDYVLTRRGEGLLPVLIAMQEFGDRWLLGDGSVAATSSVRSAESERVHRLVGTTLPDLTLPAHDGSDVALRGAGWRVLYFFPGAFVSGVQGHPPGWDDIPGAPGCTLESRTYAAREPRFDAIGVGLHGVSTQRADQQKAFADAEKLPFTLLSDPDGRVAAALRLPMFRVAGAERYKRQSLLVDPGGVVRFVQAPIIDPAGSVDEMLSQATELAG